MGTHDVTETPRHSVSVAAAIFDESGENVLLIKRRDNGHWEPPGGVLELDESIEEGLRREVREETGVRVSIGPLTGVYQNISLGIVAFVFRCTPLSPPAMATDEAASIEWHPLDRLDERLEEVYAARIRDAVQASRGVALRTHNGRAFLPE